MALIERTCIETPITDQDAGGFIFAQNFRVNQEVEREAKIEEVIDTIRAVQLYRQTVDIVDMHRNFRTVYLFSAVAGLMMFPEAQQLIRESEGQGLPYIINTIGGTSAAASVFGGTVGAFALQTDLIERTRRWMIFPQSTEKALKKEPDFLDGRWIGPKVASLKRLLAPVDQFLEKWVNPRSWEFRSDKVAGRVEDLPNLIKTSDELSRLIDITRANLPKGESSIFLEELLEQREPINQQIKDLMVKKRHQESDKALTGKVE